ncbi:S-layer family protein, partial [Variovorax sp. KK3]|uniref:beta strand repeat-containing protein n=1 Tax=Variovorax sp. KK3 TaxID=1855728 RepID=UPI0015C3DE7E
MNKAYRSVWNEAIGAWVAVSEATATRGKRSSGLATVVVAAGLGLLAAPGGAQVVYNNGDVLTAPIDTTPSNITLQSADAGTATQSGVISGTNGIIKTGAGIVVLTGNNTYQGNTTINAGALQVSTDDVNSNLGAPGGGIVLDGGALRIGASNFESARTITVGAANGAIDVAGTVGNLLTGQITGTGVLTLRNSGTNALGVETQRLAIDNATNNYSGGTVLEGNGTAGRLNVQTSTAGSLGTGPVTVGTNAELRFQGPGASAGALAITVQPSTDINGTNSGIQFQGGATAGTATINVNGAGSYAVFGGGAGSGSTAQQANITNNGGRLVFQESSTGGSAAIANTSGTLQVANVATLSGASVVNGPTGQIYVHAMNTGVNAAIGSLSGTGIVVLGDATLEVGALGKNDVYGGVIGNTGPGLTDSKGSIIINPILAGNGAVVKVGAGTLALTGDNTYTNGTTISAGAIQLGNGGATGSVQGTITNNASLVVNRSDNYALGNLIDGTGSLTQAGTGTTTVTNALNTYGNGTVLKAGGLTVASGASIGGGALTLIGGTLGTPAVNQVITNAVVLDGAANLAPNASTTWSGPVTLASNSTLTMVPAQGTLTFAGAIGGGGGITLDASAAGSWGSYNFQAANNYAGATTVQGNAALVVNGAGNVPGALTINGNGTVFTDGNARLSPTATVTVNSAGNNVNGQAQPGLLLLNAAQTIGQLDGTGTVGLAGSTLTVGAGTFSGSIANSPAFSATPGSLVKNGVGTLALSGINTYTGATTVAGGTLRAGAVNTLSAASAHTVAVGATLDTAGFNQTVASLNNSGTVSLVSGSAGSTLTVTGPYVGNAGTLSLGTVLNTNGPSDRLVLDGATAVASGNTTVQITNRGGLGGLTTGNGIEVITALNGATTTAQTTKNAFALGGGHVDAGAFEYRLYAADAGGAGENWYLRSQVIPPPPPPPSAKAFLV